MVAREDLDKRIELLGKYFETDDIILAGGLAAYLNTDVFRETDDVDLIGVNRKGLGQKKAEYQRKVGVRVDIAELDYAFDSINLSDGVLQWKALKTKRYADGSTVKYLGAEAIVATKLTSFCVDDDSNLPTEYGLKVLRDKDLHDIRNLKKVEGFDEDLLCELLGTVAQLDEIEDPTVFWQYADRVLGATDAPVSFIKNAFGIARYLARIPEQHRESEYADLKQSAEEHQTPQFATYVDREKFLKAYELDE